MPMPTVGLPTRLVRSEVQCTAYTQIVPAGFTPEDVASSQFWQHVAPQLRQYDIVEAVAADGSFELRMRLVHKIMNAMEWRVLHLWRPDQIEAGEAQFVAKWLGPSAKWGVVEAATGKKVADGLSKDEAVTLADKHNPKAAA